MVNTRSVFSTQPLYTNPVLDISAGLVYHFGMDTTANPPPAMSPTKTTPNFIKAHRVAAGLAQHELAERMGTTQATVTRLETGVRQINLKWLARLAAALGRSETELLRAPADRPENNKARLAMSQIAMSEVPPLQSLPNAQVASEATAQTMTRRRIDILGWSAGGKDGRFIMNGQASGQIFCPPGVETALNPYALIIDGMSMAPRYEDGEMVIANPDVPYRKGDYVVVQLSTNEPLVHDCYVKRFVSFSSKELILEQLSPPRGGDAMMRFPADRVRAIHKLVGPDGR